MKNHVGMYNVFIIYTQNYFFTILINTNFIFYRLSSLPSRFSETLVSFSVQLRHTLNSIDAGLSIRGGTR